MASSLSTTFSSVYSMHMQSTKIYLESSLNPNPPRKELSFQWYQKKTQPRGIGTPIYIVNSTNDGYILYTLPDFGHLSKSLNNIPIENYTYFWDTNPPPSCQLRSLVQRCQYLTPIRLCCVVHLRHLNGQVDVSCLFVDSHIDTTFNPISLPEVRLYRNTSNLFVCSIFSTNRIY